MGTGLTWNLIFLTLVGLPLALIAPSLARRAPIFAGWALSLYPFAIFAGLLRAAREPEPLTFDAAWLPQLGLTFSFYIDPLAILFGCLISGIGGLVLIYAGAYMKASPKRGPLFGYLLLFMVSMLGVVFAGSLMTLFVFWEMTSVSSFLLIGLNHEKFAARRAALQALLITGGGGLALLAGLILLGVATGHQRWESLLQVRGLGSHPLYPGILALLVLGAATKSAQFPFHTWLPRAMEAPTPVSAYLHSATMVKAGVYLLARFSPVMGGTELWFVTLACLGAATLVTGAVHALFVRDLKQMLAYSTLSALGCLVLLLAGGERGALAAAVFLVGHALYKGALFLIAGIVDHATGSRDALHLHGLARKMPLLGGVALLACLSLAGFGPFLSFIGKELALESTLHFGSMAWLWTLVVFMGAISWATVAAVLLFRVFYGSRDPARSFKSTPWPLYVGPIVLSALALGFGLWPGTLPFGDVARGIAPGVADPKLALWHGLNPALFLTLLGFAAAIPMYRVWPRLVLSNRFAEHRIWTPQKLYEQGLVTIERSSAQLASRMQSGHLRHYITIILMTTVLLVMAALSRWDLPILSIPVQDIQNYEVMLCALILGGTVSAVRATTRISAVASLGVVGLGVALVYVLYGAPDLAMTQFAIEALTVVLFVLVFHHLPRISTISGRATRLRDGFVSALFGGTVTVLILLANTVTIDQPISDYFAENSVPKGHGRNIVNVILVDFRALDTLGEITVLSLAAIGVYGLIRLRPTRRGGGGGSSIP